MNKLSALKKIKAYFEGIKEFAFDPRTGSCEYLTSDGRMCAIGVLATNPKAMPENTISVIMSDYRKGFLPLDNPNYDFIGELAEDESNFWCLIQQKHDTIAEDIFAEQYSFEEGQEKFLNFVNQKISKLEKHI